MKAKKLVSIILSALMVCSLFTGLTTFADETNGKRDSKVFEKSGATSSVYSVATEDEAYEEYSGTTGDCTWHFDGTSGYTVQYATSKGLREQRM